MLFNDLFQKIQRLGARSGVTRRLSFFRARVETLPIVLTQRRIYILPTRTGMLFVVVLILMLTGAINYNLSLGHALTFLLAGLFFVSIFHTVRNLLELRIVPGNAAPVFAGETAKFPVFLENPRPNVRCALALSIAPDDESTADVAASASASVAVSCAVSRRGVFLPGRMTLSSRYPLGFFRAWAYLTPDVSCLVYPRPIRAPLPKHSETFASDQWQGGKGQDDFTGLRQRQPNESFRRVAWKAAARDAERPLLNKQFSGGGARELILDWTMTSAEPDAEARLSILTGWILESEKQHIAYGLRLPECSFPPSHGARHRDACLKALALHA
ncbi:MAG: DUF58 domain-containing protein [Candidatus Accumulibacter sp.]|nr:DUF58 domain-containing protein [Accumulibacter sp.]